MVNGCRESDNLIVSERPANKIRDNKRIAEQVERRRLAKGNQVKQNRVRTQRREALQSELDRIRQAAQRGKRVQFTAIWHHLKVNWVLDVDIRGFFDAIDHEWMMRFVEHRIRDKRVLRHIRKWLKAGVMEDGQRLEPEEGTPQGGSVSPLLSNIYLHYVFDVWADKWRKESNGDVIMVRFADDIVVGFQYEHEARKFLKEMKARFRKFNLEVHAEKTRLLEFGRFAAQRRKERGKGRPETFNFLGFTHICGTTRKGQFTVHRRTIAGKMRSKLKEIKQTLRRRMHWPVPKVGAWLKSVLVGHYRYYGVPNNWRMLSKFRWAILKLWLKTLRQRSQKHRMTWKRMYRVSKPWLPNPCIYHDYPSRRLRVST